MRHTDKKNRGSVLALVAVCLTVLMGFVALAIDVGRLATAKVQCQNAADAAALAGARTINGSANSNLSAATANATTMATSWQVLGAFISPSEVSVQHGAYHYDYPSQTFYPQFPPVAPDNYNLSQVTIAHQVSGTFCGVLGSTFATVTATSTAAHRPRDVAIVLDYSGSMNNESDLWNVESYLGTMVNTPNNTDPVFPQFGPYNPTFSPNATLQCTSNDPRVGMCNVTQAVLGVPTMATDFYQNNAGAAGALAFTPASNVCTAPVAGDNYLTANGKCVLTWSDAVNPNTSFFPGYSNFQGFTQGPKYWGKTFFIWPPQPGTDWRKLYFKLTSGSPLNDDTKLWSSSGMWNNPPNNYQINYAAILNWIKNTGPNPFPPQLRAGNVLYYSTIPTDVPASAYNPSNPNSQITNPDQRFWKEYIDYTIGVWLDPNGTIQIPGTPTCSYGPDFTAGTEAVSISRADYQYKSSYAAFIPPTDNPKRPRHRLWFGPMTMIQYMSDTGILPGTTHDISMIAAKLGIAGALQDIQNNHPNDMVSMLMFSRPAYSGDAAGAAQFTTPQVTLGRNYTAMINSLWFTPNTSGDIRPWTTSAQQTPCAHGDYDCNTATDYGFMLAYNQFSSNSSLQSSGMGGWGRKGAQKIVILETDGMANVATTAGVTNNGAYQSYYNVGTLGSYSVSGASASQGAINVATAMCALTTAGSSPPGYSQPGNPVTINCIAFGAIFEPTAAGSEQTSAVSLLQQLSTIGGTTFPSSASDPVNGYKWCIGTLSQRQTLLQQAFTNILDDTVSIILVK
jgi:Flp pilus assembly protein TadG